jgi:hypothetical protein
MDVLVGTKPAHLTISIARHLSNTDTVMIVHTERHAFESALRTAGCTTPLRDRSTEPALPVTLDTTNGVWRIRLKDTEVTVAASATALQSTFKGRDIDVIATPSMDAVAGR